MIRFILETQFPLDFACFGCFLIYLLFLRIDKVLKRKILKLDNRKMDLEFENYFIDIARNFYM